MIIKNFELKNKELSKKNLFLFYGKNEGLKKEIIDEIFRKNSSYKEFKYEENEVLESYNDFILSLTNKSLFEDQKLIIINRVTDKIVVLINELIGKEITDSKIILISDILQTKSKLRKIFEKEKELICVPFYQDDNQALLKIAYNFFKKNNIQVSQQATNLIVENVMGDRKNLLTELDKLANFAKTKKTITYEEIIKLTNIIENYSTSELVDTCLSKKIAKTINIINQNNFSHEDCILILRTFLIKLKRLLKIKEILRQNDNIELAISNFKPPIFWKEKEIVKIQNSFWSIDSIKKLIDEIYEIEVLVKKNTINSINIVSDFIINKASKA